MIPTSKTIRNLFYQRVEQREKKRIRKMNRGLREMWKTIRKINIHTR